MTCRVRVTVSSPARPDGKGRLVGPESFDGYLFRRLGIGVEDRNHRQQAGNRGCTNESMHGWAPWRPGGFCAVFP